MAGWLISSLLSAATSKRHKRRKRRDARSDPVARATHAGAEVAELVIAVANPIVRGDALSAVGVNVFAPSGVRA